MSLDWSHKQIIDKLSQEEFGLNFAKKIAHKYIDFLAKQSDLSLSGAMKNSPFHETRDFSLNNQRITKDFLQSFLRRSYHD